MSDLFRGCPSLRYERNGAVAVVSIDRPTKRNALNESIVVGLGAFFRSPPEGIRAALLTTSGDHFSAGLDLAELKETTLFEGIEHSRGWHREFDAMQFGTLPIVSVLKGAVIGGGLELAAATHIRVAEPSTFYALPEGTRGLFVGGGASVRLPRLIGVSRMADMMLTGRVLTAQEGYQLGISQYLVGEGEGYQRGIALAERIAANAPVTNYAVVQALPRIAEMSPSEGLFVESLVAAISQESAETKTMLRAFLEGRSEKVVAARGAAE